MDIHTVTTDTYGTTRYCDVDLIDELTRRTGDIVGTLRAADSKAGLLLAGIGVVAGNLDGLPYLGALVVGGLLVVAAVLLALVLLPRIGTGPLAWTASTPVRAVLDGIARAAMPSELARELAGLTAIARTKHALIRAALSTLVLAGAAYAVACLG